MAEAGCTSAAPGSTVACPTGPVGGAEGPGRWPSGAVGGRLTTGGSTDGLGLLEVAPGRLGWVMDWKLLLTTFASVFVAELGDKTQLATLGFAAEGRSRLAVFLGSSLALVATSLMAVLLGGLIARVVAPSTLQRGAGALFILLGIWTLVKAGG